MTYDRDEIAAIADEYVLGLLEPAEAARVEAEMEKDAELKAAIAAGRDRFLPLDNGSISQPVSEGLWQRIEAALPAQTRQSAFSFARPANDNSSRPWKMAAFASMAAVFVLAIGLAFNMMRTVEPLVIAVLVNETGEVQAVVEDFGNEQATIRMLADYHVPANKTIQVWTLPSREMGPVSLGVIEGVRSARLGGPLLPTPRNDQLYEITLEQVGGSPTGRPTGPILAKGFARLPR